MGRGDGAGGGEEAACGSLVLDGWWWCPPLGAGAGAQVAEAQPGDGAGGGLESEPQPGCRRPPGGGADVGEEEMPLEAQAGGAAAAAAAPAASRSPAAKRPRLEQVVPVQPRLQPRPQPQPQPTAAPAPAPAGPQPPLPPPQHGDDAVSALAALLRKLQDATVTESPADASSATWQSLQAEAETCAAGAGAVPGAVVSAALAATTSSTASMALPLPPEAVLLCVRRLVTPGLGGGAARLLLAAVVLPAVEAVERVMPKPLLEALAAAVGPHPRPLTEAVLAPAAQRRGLSAGQCQLLLKAATAGSTPLPRQLQAQLLVAVCAPHVAAQWCERQVALAQGLVEAAKQGLDEDTASAVAAGICAAVRSGHLAKSVALCRLLLTLVSRAGGGGGPAGRGLGRAELQQLQEAAGATSTIMTKQCLTELQKLTR